MYFPRAGYRHLREYEYFPSDSDTADVSSQGWWERILTALSEFSIGILFIYETKFLFKVRLDLV